MQRIGDYNLIECIGAGGMGEVWLGENVHTKLRFALKLLPLAATSDKTFVARFFDEGRVMGQLEHARIVRVHHVGQDEKSNRYYLVMDYVEGPDGKAQSLHDIINESPDNRLDEAQAREWSLQIAQGLAYAHEKGVVHRDIKPANILIDKDGNARITDFGLAKAIGEEFLRTQIHQSIKYSMHGSLSDQPTMGQAAKTLSDQPTVDTGSSGRTTAESLLGTYDYMSPEQRGELKGVEVGPASDVYAFGVMLYRLLTGRRPTGMAKAPSDLVKGLSPAWNAVIARCLEHQPKDRFADGTQLVAVLKAQRYKGPKAQSLKWAIAVLLLVLGGIGAYWGYPKYKAYQSHQQQDQTAQRRTEIASLFQQAQQHYEAKDYAQALVVLGRLEAISPADPNSAALRTSIEAAMKRTPGATEPTEATKVSYRIKVSPPDATITLTHDQLGLITEQSAENGTLDLSLEPGTYHALVTAEGFRTVQRDIEVDPSQTTWSVRLSERRGELVVISNPGVSVNAAGTDGKTVPFGQTDAQGRLTIGTLREGDYTITLSLADYESETANVTLTEGRQTEIKKQLEPLPGRLKLGGRSGLEIYKAGRRLGQANEWIDLPAGDHDLELRCRGYRTERITVTIPPNRPVVKQSPALVAESGTIRVSAESTVSQDNYLAKQQAKIRIDGGQWRQVELPFTEEGLSCEDHRVELQVSGYESAQAQATEVRDSQTANVVFRLTPQPGTVTLTCNATQAEILDSSGTRVGRAGQMLSLAPFINHTLTVQAPRYESSQVQVRMDRPGQAKGTRQIVLVEQKLPSDLEEVVGAQYASLDSLASGSREAQQRQRDVVKSLSMPLEVKTRKLGIVLRLIPAGTFRMGSPSNESGLDDDEKQHRVTLTKAFYCGKFEVTQGQWQQVMGNNPSRFTAAGRDAPVEQVSWDDCKGFLKKLCQLEGVAQGTYRLLTEAEWEYACRAGTETSLYIGDLVIKGQNNGPALDPIAWYGGNSGVNYKGAYDSSGWKEKQYSHSQAGTHAVGQKNPNAYGVHDMIGNVWEWCQDWYGEYPSGGATDPSGPRSGANRVDQGGSWFSDAGYCRSAIRLRRTPDKRLKDLGFRLARATPSLP